MKNVEWVEVLPFHQMGAFKWKALGLDYKLADTPTPDGRAGAAPRSTSSAPPAAARAEDRQDNRPCSPSSATSSARSRSSPCSSRSALGYAVGQINILGFSLGVGAVLFVGLFLGAIAPKAQIAGPIGLIGLIMFLYGIGILYGRQFFEGLSGAGRIYNLLAFVAVARRAAGGARPRRDLRRRSSATRSASSRAR